MKVKAAAVQARKRDGGRTRTSTQPGIKAKVRTSAQPVMKAKARPPTQPGIKAKARGRTSTRTQVSADDSQQKVRNTRVGQKSASPYTVGGKAENKSKQLLYVGLASILGAFLLLILIVVAVSGNDRGKALNQPKRASVVPTRRTTTTSAKGQYGAKYATYDPNMVMTEESQLAKDRKKRRSSGGR